MMIGRLDSQSLERIADAECLASGWNLSLRVFERLRRIEEGRPLLELVKPENRPGPA